ncbi:MAG: CpsD/CapB family tyrosine-protein kinase [Candidatus Polarisedimenticolia bacterium]
MSAATGIDPRLVSLVAPGSFEAEQYRALRQRLERRHEAGAFRIVAITSATVSDGKTTTAINLAGALAQASDTRVLLVDADLRRPAIATHLGLENPDGAGLVDAILDPAGSLRAVTRPLPGFNLTVVTAGRFPPSPYEVLRSARLGILLEEARRAYDYVVVDTPPILPVPDTRLITPVADALILVVAAHRTPRGLLAEALRLLDPAKVAGLVFNGDDRPLSGYSAYYEGYGRRTRERSRSGVREDPAA